MVVESCGLGERCDAVPVSEDPENTEYDLTCVAEGTAEVGDTCDYNADCIAGAACALDTCRAFCDVNGGCTGEDVCHSFGNTSGVVFDLCEPSCDLLGDDCPEMENCTPLQTSSICLAGSLGIAIGDSCTYLNACVAGAICVGVDGSDPGVCTELCATTESGGCAQANEICYPLPLYEEFAELVAPGVGACMFCDPADASCEPLYTGGCLEASDCDVVSAAFERTYTCDETACVETLP